MKDCTTEATLFGSKPAWPGAALRARRSAIDMLAASVPGLFCISVGASAHGGALGMASGIFIVPILTLVANVDVHLAIGASLVSVIACSFGSAGPFL